MFRFDLFVVGNRIPEVALMDDQYRRSRFPKIDRPFHFAAIAGKCPAWVSTGSNHQIVGLLSHVRREGGTQSGDLIDYLFACGLGGRAGECEDAAVERDLRTHRADSRQSEGFRESGLHALGLGPRLSGKGILDEILEERPEDRLLLFVDLLVLKYCGQQGIQFVIRIGAFEIGVIVKPFLKAVGPRQLTRGRPP